MRQRFAGCSRQRRPGAADFLALLLFAIHLGQASAKAADNGLSRAQTALHSARYSEAIATINESFKAGRLSRGHAARALLVRGQAYLRTARPAQAIADLSSAIWTQDLPPALQKRAKALRKEAYAASGILTTPALTPRTGRVSKFARVPARRAPAKPPSNVPPARAAQPQNPPRPQAIARPLNAQPRKTTARRLVTRPLAPPRKQWQTTSVQHLQTRTTRVSPPRIWPTATRPTPPPVSQVKSSPPPRVVARYRPLPAKPWSTLSTGSTATNPPPRPPAFAEPAMAKTPPPAGASPINNPEPPPAASGFGLFDVLFANSQPTSPEIDVANQLQRRRTEQIRAHNARLKASGQIRPAE